MRRKKRMLGVYLWDYANNKPMDTELFKLQLQKCKELILAANMDGAVFCSSTLGDADLETNRILKQFVAENRNIKVPEIDWLRTR